MSFIVTEKAMRPASPERECFYCRQKIGEEHKDDCVLIQKQVKVRAVIEIPVSVPAFWDKEGIEFHRNESSWCANNFIDELTEFTKKECLCGYAEFEYIGDLSEPFLDE